MKGVYRDIGFGGFHLTLSDLVLADPLAEIRLFFFLIANEDALLDE